MSNSRNTKNDESNIQDSKTIHESVDLVSIIPKNYFIKKVITDLCNRSMMADKTIPAELRFQVVPYRFYAHNKNKFYQAKYQKHFPHDNNCVGSMNWYAKFLLACEKEYAGLSPVVRQLYMLTKEEDLLAIKHTLNAAKLRLPDLLSQLDSNEKSLMEWVSLSKNPDFKDQIFNEVCAQLCHVKNECTLSELDVDTKNMLFSYAVGLQLSKQTLMELKNAGANINHINNGLTPLDCVVELGDYDSVVKLVECGVDVNPTGTNASPLCRAHRHNFDKIETYLEQHGAMNQFQCRIM